MLNYIALVLLMFFEFPRIEAINPVNITGPHIIDVRDIASLSCQYNIGFQKLNSVKWYKDGKEFYRYTPFSVPSETRMQVKGVQISRRHQIKCDEKACRIYLENLSVHSSGIYKCEIAGEAPDFRVIQNHSNMTVVVLPKRDPVIHGLKTANYKFGDIVEVNCTSDISSAPATLYWYINDQKAPAAFLKPQQTITNALEGFSLHYRILELRFTIEKSRFHDTRGRIKLQCVSKIERLPTQPIIRETSIHINVLKSDNLKNQKLIDNSGATQTSSTSRLLPFICILLLFRHINSRS